MSRRRTAGPPTGMPPELVAFSPAEWSDDPEDPVDWYYFGRHRWMDARADWLAGGNPQTRMRGQREHGSGRQRSTRGIAPHPA